MLAHTQRAEAHTARGRHLRRRHVAQQRVARGARRGADGGVRELQRGSGGGGGVVCGDEAAVCERGTSNVRGLHGRCAW
eukprot:7163709-Prymnesium_polylepis.1